MSERNPKMVVVVKGKQVKSLLRDTNDDVFNLVRVLIRAGVVSYSPTLKELTIYPPKGTVSNTFWAGNLIKSCEQLGFEFDVRRVQ
jgi:hypothetical protein